MSNTKMPKDSNALNVLTLFANYGFRKASMNEIATAAGLSRQSIYNQFGSKEAVLDWAVTSFLDTITDRALHCLGTADAPATQTLVSAYQAWIGDHLPLVRGTPHGAELLDQTKSAAESSTRDYEGEFTRAIETFLLTRGMAPSEEAAKDAAYVLNLASKGLLLKVGTPDDYARSLERVINVLFR
ncbi:TetR/AcrR family transcriptional regulator [Ruegeria sp. SCP11]|uniref:TetR/AcrR family transcriptional regulator n=1 Tax=Ruegeria sp. SCP11 TaxID=3141378 RepID=UPI00333B9A09